MKGMTEPRTPAGRRLYEDLAFAAPEMRAIHIDRRIEEAVDEENERIRQMLLPYYQNGLIYVNGEIADWMEGDGHESDR